MRSMTLLLSWFLASVMIVGCGGSGKPTAYPVKGTVLVKGKPADGALIVLHPTSGDTHRPLGYVEADGSFKLTTYAEGDGAPAGTYKVTVEWRPKKKSSMEADGPDRLNGRYADAKNSKIEVTVNKSETTLDPIKID